MFTAEDSTPVTDKSERLAPPDTDRLEVKQSTGYYAEFCVIYPGKGGDLQPLRKAAEVRKSAC